MIRAAELPPELAHLPVLERYRFEAVPDSTFGALYEAEKQARDLGYEVGPTSRVGPYCGLVPTSWTTFVPKWHNLSRAERRELAGVLVCLGPGDTSRDAPIELLIVRRTRGQAARDGGPR